MHDHNQRRAMLSWLFVGALFVLCGVLGVLQYGWIGEVSVAARERLGHTLQTSLNQLSQDMSAEIAAACQAMLPATSPQDAAGVEAEVTERFQQWKKATRFGGLFKHVAVAVPRNDDTVLVVLDPNSGSLESMAWPESWSGLRQRFQFLLSPQRFQGQPGPPPQDPNSSRAADGLLFEAPIMRATMGATTRTSQPAVRPAAFVPRELAWVIFELNPDYLRDSILPELVQNHLGAGGVLDYQVEVWSRNTPGDLIWRSDPKQTQSIASTADASVIMLDPRLDQGFRGPQMLGALRAFDRRPSASGRWQLFVRHRSGSLEAVVARARARNLAVTAGLLLLMIASVAALIRFTRQAERLAALQMEFVAGVSHELRTPLTVINTAGYNLRGRVAQNPAQVEKYGVLIQQESGKLKDMVEQVLGFARANSGRVINDREPVSVESLIEQTVESSRAAVQQANGVIEKSIDPSLPPILADPMALKHALGNLLTNAAKYGMEGNNWIGIFARKIESQNQPMVEIKVVDRGPGIPEDEQARVFDPFFRGRRALQDQVHGTGLGLNLAKRIVEAHGGSIDVKSIPGRGTEFTIRIPAALPEHEDEFANTTNRG